MKRRKPLRWSRQTASIPSNHPLRSIMRGVALRSFDVAADTAPVVAAEEAVVDIDWPIFESCPTPKDKTECLLQIAAEVEHALLVQYLYSAYSIVLPASDARRKTFVSVAVEEMAHLMTVQNLLLAIGSSPYLLRQDFGPPGADDERLFPFDLMLEPLSKGSLAKYILAEAPEQPWPNVPATLVQTIIDAAGADESPVNRVGLLYTLIGVFFSTPELLDELKDEGPWYAAVYKLAEDAANHYGGPEEVHLPADFPFVADPRFAPNDDWNRPATEGFQVDASADHKAILQALEHIALQGEGPSPVSMHDSHFSQFLARFQSFFGPDGQGNNLPPVHPVPSATVIVVGDDGDINSKEATPWARLADLRYALLLGFLEEYLRSPSDDRFFLASWCFSEMYHLQRLGLSLPRRKRTAASDNVAALPFNMPSQFPSDAAPATQVHWSNTHAAVLQSAIDTVDTILVEGSEALPLDDEEKEFLEYMRHSDGRKLAEAIARQSGQSIRTNLDKVREILEWSAGTGTPTHQDFDAGRMRCRFWNLPLNSLKELKIWGRQVIAPAGPNRVDQSGLVMVLKPSFSPRMPVGRKPLSDEQIKFIQDWIDSLDD